MMTEPLPVAPKLAAVALDQLPVFHPASDVTSIPSAEVGGKSGVSPGGRFLKTTSTVPAAVHVADAATAPGV